MYYCCIFFNKSMYYADDLRNDMDINLANEIYKDVSAEVENISDYYIMIIGRNNQQLPASALSGEVMGVSLFNFNSEIEPKYFWSTDRIVQIWKIEGKQSVKGANYANKALEYVNNNEMKSYPQKGYIKIIDDLIIVKLSDNI